MYYYSNTLSFLFHSFQVQFQREADEKRQHFHTLVIEEHGQDGNFFSLNEYYAFLQRAPKETTNPLY